MSKKYYWLKLKDNFFNKREIKKLRRLAGGDTFVIIYLKMQLMAMKEEGWIYFERTENDIYNQLELEIDEDSNNIRMTIGYLKANNLLYENDEKDCFLQDAVDNTGKECDSASRVRRLREKKKQFLALQSNTLTLQSNNDVTNCNTEIEIEIEDTLSSKKPDDVKKDNKVNEIIDYLNTKTGKQFKTGTKKTQSLISARIKEGFTIEDFKKVIDIKCKEWLQDSSMTQYLRPETLFGTKFEGYLNQCTTVVIEQKNIYREKIY